MAERGKYIVIEGGDGVGKSTALPLIAEGIRDYYGVEVLTVEEPSSIKDEAGTPLLPELNTLREKIILNGELEHGPKIDMALFNYSRSINWFKGIKPALYDGKWVLSARNYWSTIVYQGAGDGLDAATIDAAVLESTEAEYMHPDLGFLFDIDEETRVYRLALRKNPDLPDTFESKPTDFQIRVGDGYRQLAKDRDLTVVSTLPSPDEIAAKALAHIIQTFKKPGH